MIQKSYKYQNGKPYSAIEIETALDHQIARVQQDKPSMILVDGVMGSGKTTLAIHLADYINSKYGLPPLKLEDNTPQYAIGGGDFTTKLRQSYEQGYPVIIYDESGDFNRKGSLTKFNRSLDQIFQTYRAYKIIVILVLPNFSILSQNLFRDAIPRMLFHCGHRTITYGRATCYSLHSMLYILKSMRDRKTVIEQHAYKNGRISFNSRFLDLEPERAACLKKTSMQGKRNILVKSEIALQGLLSYDDLSHKLNKSKMTIRLKVSQLKLKPSLEIKRTKYFTQDTLLTLQRKFKIIKLNP